MRRSWCVTCVTEAAIVALLGGPFEEAHAQEAELRGLPFQFVDVTDQCGIQEYTSAFAMCVGVSAADFDEDGDIDLFVPTARGVPDQLYRNRGDGTFEEIAAEVGVDSLERTLVALWLDYDADHRLDLLVAGDCWLDEDRSCPDRTTIKLYRQMPDGQFVDVAAESGFGGDLVFTTIPHRGGMCAGDVDGDGYIDVFVGLWAGSAGLFRNLGTGRFVNDSVRWGVGRPDYYWQPVLYDFTRDGRPELFCSIDYNPNRFYVNTGARFVDEAKSSGTDQSWNEMGVTLGDYDEDGDLDIFITNITSQGRFQELYRNDTVDGVLSFTEVAHEAGVEDASWGWGCTFMDANNDTHLDLAVTNGFFDNVGDGDSSRFFMNAGDDPSRFIDVSDLVGFNDTLWGSGLIAIDYDRDGDLDLVQVCNGNGTERHALRVLENRENAPGSTGNYLVIRPRMFGRNHWGIGTEVNVTIGERTQMRIITAGISCLSQEPAEAHVGIADAERVDRVDIRWPDGRTTALIDVDANQVLTAWPVTFTDVSADAGVGLPDTLTESVAWGDFDNDGDEDLYLTIDGTNRLFRNEGGDVFTDVTVEAGVGNTLFGVGTGFADLDNDGDLDLYVVNFGGGRDVLYRNSGPVGGTGTYVFTDVTVKAGTTIERSSRGMAFIDYDRDGLLDIYVNAIGQDILYHNLGDLVFEDVAAVLGLDAPGQGVGVVATDVDGNGWIDLYTANRSGELSNLYLNDGGTFTDVAALAGLDAQGLGMGVLAFDYDNDLDMDLYWTTWPGGEDPAPNRLYENDGDGTSYTDVTDASGTADPSGWGISCNAGDIDNDRLVDFFVTNGFDPGSGPNVLFRNRGDGGFDDATAALGGADGDGRGVAFADYDGDGDLDLVLTGSATAETRLWRNDTRNGNHWITLKLVGTTSNRSAIGARVEVTAAGARTVGEVSGGAGRGSFNSLPVEFGLGAADAIETVFIRWPSGVPQLLTEVPIDTTTTVTEPAAGDVNGNGVVDFVDLLTLLAAWGDCPPSPAYCLADRDANGVVGVRDMLIVLATWD